MANIMLISSKLLVDVPIAKEHGVIFYGDQHRGQDLCVKIDRVSGPTICRSDRVQSPYAISGSCVSRTILMMSSL